MRKLLRFAGGGGCREAVEGESGVERGKREQNVARAAVARGPLEKSPSPIKRIQVIG
jgi:hypothetical protein